MNLLKLSAILAAGLLVPVAASAQCANASGCNSVVTIGPGGVLTIAGVAGSTPYDGSDDNAVGVINNSGMTIANFSLSGSGNGGGLFAFDGDGIDGYLSTPVTNPLDTTGYGGPLAYFTNISSDLTTGTVNFAGGLADGQQTFFSLESDFATAVVTPGPGTPGAVTPEPSTFVLLGTGALGAAAQLRRRFLA